MGAKRPPRATFAEILATVPEHSEPAEQFSYAVPHPWITVDGARWHVTREPHRERCLHKRLLQADLVFHEYMGKRTVIAPDRRESFWQRALDLMDASAYSDFVGYEYRDADGARCLVVYESC
jgi:hypothetical protein